MSINSELYHGFDQFKELVIDPVDILKDTVLKFNFKYENCISVRYYDEDTNQFTIYVNKELIDKEKFELISKNYCYDEDEEDDFGNPNGTKYFKLEDTRDGGIETFYKLTLDYQDEWDTYINQENMLRFCCNTLVSIFNEYLED